MKNVELCVIAAVSIDGVIGIGDTIPWKIKSDQLNYKKVTTGNHVIVGGKTYLTLPNVAKEDRIYDILTKNPDYYSDNHNKFTNIDSLLNYLENNEDLKGKVVYVAGGSQVYEQLIDKCDSAIITWVSKTYINGDKHFPIDKIFNDFDMVNDSEWVRDSNSPLYKITHYKRSNK